MIGPLHFLRPEWFVLVPVLLAGFWLLVRRRTLRGGWLTVIDPNLAPFVLEEAARGRRGRWMQYALLLAALLGVFAMTGPSWEQQQQPLYRSDDALVLVLDLSRSMDASDIAPSRLTRVRLKLLDILEQRASGQTALIVYSGNAFTVTPLTDDVDTIAAMVNSLSTDIMPSRGSYPGVALRKAANLMQQAGVSDGAVLLITDSPGNDNARDVAAQLRAQGYGVSVLGAGTEDGGPIPTKKGGFLTGQDGRIVVAKMHERELRAIASSGGGRYRRLSIDASDISGLLQPARGHARKSSDSASEMSTADIWRDGGPYFLLLLLPFAMLIFRRGYLPVLAAIIVLPAAESAQAGILDDLFWREDQQAAREFNEGRHKEAARLFEDEAWKAAAQYRNGDFAGSAQSLQGFDTADGHYNRGNALARRGEFDAAIAAYDAALAKDMKHEDARYNRQLLMDQQSRDEEGSSQDQSSPDPQQSDSGEQSDGEKQESDQGSSSSSQDEADADGESSDDEESSAQSQRADSAEEEQQQIEALQKAMREAQERNADESQPATGQQMIDRAEQEQDEAMEQWLRRVPHDPGGLLRRKFLDQYRRQGTDQDGNLLWPDDDTEPW